MKLYLWLAVIALIPQITLAKTDKEPRPSPYTGSEVLSVEIERHGYLQVNFTNR